eukprot:c29303_g1_i2 orf=236-2935(-)
MAVYFKFKSAKDYDSISVEGHFISVGNLKEKIVEKKNLGRGSDFDLVISNAQTNEEYTDEGILVPKNTSVLVRRVPGRPPMPIVTETRDEKVPAEAMKDPAKSVRSGVEVSAPSHMKQHEDSDWADEFGMDLYTMPEDLQAQPVVNKTDEDNMIKAFVDASASDWQRQTQEGLFLGRGLGRGSQGRSFGGRGFGRMFEKKTPPPGYICHRCGVSGHYIQHCPTNGDPAFDIKKVKLPTGIPKSMLVANPDGSYALPSGGVAVLRPNEAVFEKEIEFLPSNKAVGEIPLELRCPLCGGVLKDAVLTSKCCFKSYCDKCIRDHIITKGKCVCGMTNVLADDLLPNRTLREAINRLLEATTTTTTSSAENAGSRHQVQDMESARYPIIKASPPSPTASQKETLVTLLQSDGLNAKEQVLDRNHFFQGSKKSTEKTPGHKKLDSFDHMPESLSIREPLSQEEVLVVESVPLIDEEVQQQLPNNDQVKKKKGKPKRHRPPQGGNEMHWRGVPQDFSEESGMMMYGGNSGPYSNYWAQPQWLGDGYVQPYGGNIPYPFNHYGGREMIFGGAMMAHEPFGGPALMQPAPAFQRNCIDYGMGTFNPGSGIMSREEFESRKAELRRKRELEQRMSNREQAKDSSRDCIDVGSTKSKVRKSSLMSSPVRKNVRQSPDMEEDAERHSLGRAGTGLSSSLGRRWHESKDEIQSRGARLSNSDGKFDSQSRDVLDKDILHKGVDLSVRTETRSKASVFSRISFPERSKKSSVEKETDNAEVEGDGKILPVGLKSRINYRAGRSSGEKSNLTGIDSMDAAKHSPDQLRESGKSINGKRVISEEERVRPVKESAIRKAYDELDGKDGTLNKHDLKGRQYPNSMYETCEKGLEHSKGSNRKPVRVDRERVGMGKA